MCFSPFIISFFFCSFWMVSGKKIQLLAYVTSLLISSNVFLVLLCSSVQWLLVECFSYLLWTSWCSSFISFFTALNWLTIVRVYCSSRESSCEPGALLGLFVFIHTADKFIRFSFCLGLWRSYWWGPSFLPIWMTVYDFHLLILPINRIQKFYLIHSLLGLVIVSR